MVLKECVNIIHTWGLTFSEEVAGHSARNFNSHKYVHAIARLAFNLHFTLGILLFLLAAFSDLISYESVCVYITCEYTANTGINRYIYRIGGIRMSKVRGRMFLLSVIRGCFWCLGETIKFDISLSRIKSKTVRDEIFLFYKKWELASLCRLSTSLYLTFFLTPIALPLLIRGKLKFMIVSKTKFLF